MRIWYVIPARKGSKGAPGKNRRLYPLVCAGLPEGILPQTVLTTDDEALIAAPPPRAGIVIYRPPGLATDTATMRDVVMHAASTLQCDPPDILVVLYPTYPRREWQIVEDALERFVLEGRQSVVGCHAPATHPYMCYEVGPDGRGRSVIDHEYYRRQQYPEVVEVSHALCIARTGILGKLNARLICGDTQFWTIPRLLDVDDPAQLGEI